MAGRRRSGGEGREKRKREVRMFIKVEEFKKVKQWMGGGKEDKRGDDENKGGTDAGRRRRIMRFLLIGHFSLCSVGPLS